MGGFGGDLVTEHSASGGHCCLEANAVGGKRIWGLIPQHWGIFANFK